MKIHLNSLPWQSLSVALMGQMAMTSPAAAADAAPAPVMVSPTGISCVNLDASGKPVVSSPALAGPTMSVAPRLRPAVARKETAKVAAALPKAEAAPMVRGSWEPTYRGTGVTRMRDGAAKQRVLRLGVLWNVDHEQLGVSADEAVAALVKAGAASARIDDAGQVYFRARKGDNSRIANRAMTVLAGGSKTAKLAARDGGDPAAGIYTTRDANMTMLAQINGGRAAMPTAAETQVSDEEVAKPAEAQIQAVAAIEENHNLGVEVAMLRIDTTTDLSPEAFIDELPGGMSVIPFGTSYAVHVPAAQADAMWAAIDGEGKRVLMVGSSAPLTVGATANDSLRFCGGDAVLKRFPTPKVDKVSLTDAVLSVEGQKVNAQTGDIVLVVQGQQSGKGIEVALMRFVRR